MTDEKRCLWHASHDEDGEPTGPACGRPAVRAIYWSGTRQWSPVCDDPKHVELDEGAPAHRIGPLPGAAA